MNSSETSDHIWTIRRYIPQDGNIQNYRFENYKPSNRLLTVLQTDHLIHFATNIDAMKRQTRVLLQLQGLAIPTTSSEIRVPSLLILTWGT
jgi:hypothetical protein